MVSHDSPFAVNVAHLDGSLVLTLAGELDIATRPVLRGAVAELLNPHLKVVTLDLTGLTFVDLTGLRGLLDVKKLAAEVDADFSLRAVNDRTRQVIRLVDFCELETAIHHGDAATSV